MEPVTTQPADAPGGPLSDWDHPAWRWREEIRTAAVREISDQVVGAIEALLPLGDDAMRAGLTMLCQVWRVQQSPATVDAQRADWSRIRFEARNAGRTARGDGANCPVRLDGTGPHPRLCVECAAEAGAAVAVRHLTPPATVDAARAQSGAELLDQFLTALDTWLMRPDEPTGCLGVACMPDLRRFAAHWLPAGEIPPPLDADAIEDAQSLSVRAAAAHIDQLTRERP